MAKIRTHQDLHLEQLIVVGSDKNPKFYISDFEGEPERKGAERVEKLSPLRDIATIIRSFGYVKHLGNFAITKKADFWENEMSIALLHSYLNRYDIETIDEYIISKIVKIWTLEKTIYELKYELKYRPGYVHIPFDGILKLFE
jgi:maltose alpha-D-glucosyltransferase/alpha-amylase